jgi:glycerophosphoryl diester phosphodiesterase
MPKLDSKISMLLKFVSGYFFLIIFISCNTLDPFEKLLLEKCSGHSERAFTDLKIAAHRGASFEKPENTESAISRAIEIGADIVEIDIRFTKDEKLIVFHDDTLSRITNKTGLISNFKWNELKDLDAGSWHSDEFKNQRIPLLSEVLDKYSKDTILLLDLKERSSAFKKNLTELLNEQKNLNNIILGVWTSDESFTYCKNLPDVKQLAFLSENSHLESFKKTPVTYIHASFRRIENNPDLISKIKSANKHSSVSTRFGNMNETKQLLNYNPSIIMSDDPRQLIKSKLLINSEKSEF